jgi:hypothetical protein
MLLWKGFVGNGAVRYKTHVEKILALVKLLWEGNRFVPVFFFAKYLPCGFALVAERRG